MSLRTATVGYEHPNTAVLMQAKERNRAMIVVVGLRRYYDTASTALSRYT